MYVQRINIALTTDASGACTAYSALPHRAEIIAILYTKPVSGGFDDGSTITVTGEESGMAIWAESNVNASAQRAPRLATHTQAGVPALYAAAGVAVLDKIALGNERIKVVVASGGNTKTGTLTIILGG